MCSSLATQVPQVIMTASINVNGLDSETEEDRSLQALYKWLDIQTDVGAQSSVQTILNRDPLAFLKTHVDCLPSNLLQSLINERTTVAQRGTLPAIANRRRAYAQVHHPEELSLANSRNRLRVLWKRLGSRGIQDDDENQDATELDPPFPNIPSNDIPVSFTRQASRRQYGPPHTGELFDHPRLRRLMREQDREEEIEREQEEEEDSDEGEDGIEEEDAEAIEAFKAVVLERFVKGDVSVCGEASGYGKGTHVTLFTCQPTISPSLYAHIDFDERLDSSSAEHQQVQGLSRNVNNTADSALQASREKEQMDEDAWFDNDDDD